MASLYFCFMLNTLGDAQNIIMKTFEEFCMYTKFNVNRSRMQIMLAKDQNKDKPCIVYNYEPLELWKNLNTLALKAPRVPLNYKWNERVTCQRSETQLMQSWRN